MPHPLSRPTIYLLRSASDPDSYLAAFNEAGFSARCVPVLVFEFPNQSELSQRIQQPGRYGGLIVTSPRAVRALADVLEAQAERTGEWADKPAYAVGPKTASGLREMGLTPVGEESGHAEALASVIANKNPEKPLLFLAGSRRRDTLPDGLREAGVPFEEMEVYITRTRDDVVIQEGSGADWLVFFSPSGIEAIQQSPGVHPRYFRIAAIGPTTASALDEVGGQVEAIAEEPNPDALLVAIEQAVSEKAR